MTAITVPAVGLIISPRNPGPPPMSVMPKSLTVTQPVTSLSVESYGAPVQVVAIPGRSVHVNEALIYPQDGGPPAVTEALSRGHLAFAAPDCAQNDCQVGFSVGVPSHVTVTVVSDGGDVTLRAVTAANVDSGGGQVRATSLHGSLAVNTEGGPVVVASLAGQLQANTGGGELVADGVTGPFQADTEGGPLAAGNVSSSSVNISTGGDQATLAFTKPPSSVLIDTQGGPAVLAMPVGPYALTTDSGGGPEVVGISTDPASHRSVSISTQGGFVEVEPSSSESLPVDRFIPQDPAGNAPVPPVPPVPPIPPQPGP